MKKIALLAVLSLFFVRIRGKDTDTFRAWGYPWAPATFVIASAAMLVNEIIRNGVTGLAGLAVITAGVPVYFVFARRPRKTL